MCWQRNLGSGISEFKLKLTLDFEKTSLLNKYGVRGVIDTFSPLFEGRFNLTGKAQYQKFDNLEGLVDKHFLLNSQFDYICRETLLFDSYVNSFSGELKSVDIRLQPSLMLSNLVSKNTFLYCDDSVSVLRKYAQWG